MYVFETRSTDILGPVEIENKKTRTSKDENSLCERNKQATRSSLDIPNNPSLQISESALGINHQPPSQSS